MDINHSEVFYQKYLIDKTSVEAIKNASYKTGISFNYLMAKAEAESSFNGDAKALSSSASGLFQFTDNTWFEVIKKYGKKHNLNKYSDKIIYKEGSYNIANAKDKNEILKLKHNSKLSSLMAAEFALENYRILSKYLGRVPNASELYIAHFLGSNGAMCLFSEKKHNPNLKSTITFENAATANPAIFYKQSKILKIKHPRTYKEVYDYLTESFFERYKKFANIKKNIEITGRKAKTIKTSKPLIKTTAYEKTIYIGDTQKYLKKEQTITEKKIDEEKQYSVDDKFKDLTMFEITKAEKKL